jgi:hypothetical protein
MAAFLTAGAAVRADDGARIKALLDKALEAHGGKERLLRLQGTTFKVEGKVQHSGQSVEFKGQWASQLPERLRVDVRVPFMGIEFKYAQVYDGDASWNSLNDNVIDLSKVARAEAVEQAWAYNLVRLPPLTGKEIRLGWLGESKVGKQAALGLSVRKAGRREVKLYFDRETGLLLETETKSRDLFDLDQEFLVETFLGDYRKIDGVPAPHKITMRRDGKPYMEMECQDVKRVAALEEAVFAKP